MSEKISGIYCIHNKYNNKIYIGQSFNVPQRLRRHKSELRGNYHKNDHLQKSWNLYGEHSFEFKLIKACKLKYLDRLEKLYIRIYNATDRRYGYNLETGGHEKKQHSMETKAKLSNILKDYYKTYGSPNIGRKASMETRRRISENHADVSDRNNPMFNEDYDNDYIYKLINEGYNPREISEIIGCSVATAGRRVKKLLSVNEYVKYKNNNLNKDYSNRKGELNSNYNNKIDNEYVYQLALNGKSIKNISNHLNVDTRTISRRLKKMMTSEEYQEYIGNMQHKKGEEHYHYKNHVSTDEILKMAKKGIPPKEIEKMVDLGQSSIRRRLKKVMDPQEYKNYVKLNKYKGYSRFKNR